MPLLKDLVYDGISKLSEFLKSNMSDETFILIPSGLFVHRVSLEGIDTSDIDTVIEAILSNKIKRTGKIIFGGYTIKYNLMVRRTRGVATFIARYKFPLEKMNYSFVTLNQLGRPQTIKLLGTNNYVVEILVDFIRREAYLLFEINMKAIPTLPSEGIASNENLMNRIRASFNYYRDQGLIKLIMDDPGLLSDALLGPFTTSGLI